MSLSTTTRDVIRLDAWRSVFEKTNRILSEQKVTVKVVHDPPHGMEEVPGWTNGLDINLNGEMASKMLKKNDPLAAVLRLKGLNYHELCHVLYTPRMTDELPRRIVERAKKTGDSTWWYAFNALEDQRIETWFAATYGSSRRYFEAVILEWIIREGNAEAAILVYGRKYLSPRIRVQSGRVFKKKYGKDLYAEFQSVIDEYITLVLPTESVKAMMLIERFRELLQDMRKAHHAQLPPLVINDNGMHNDGQPPHRDDHGVPRQGRVLIKQAQRARDKAEDVIEDAIDADLDEEARKEAEAQQGEADDPSSEDGKGSKADPQQSDGDDPQAQGNATPDQQTGEAGQDGAGAGDVEGDASEASGDPWDAPEAQPNMGGGDGAGSGAADFGAGDGSERTLEDEIKSMLDDAYDEMDDVKQDEDIQQDVDELLDAVRAHENNGRMDAQGAEARSTTFAPDSSAQLAARRVQNILLRIRQEAEPETLRRQVHGRVDVRRVLTRQAHEVDVFKVWDSGSEEETGLETVLLMDTSISMSNCIKDASTAMWALKRAFDKLDIRTTVLLYNTGHTILFQPSDRANAGGVPDVKASGGTEPSSALRQAQHILSKSQAPNKVLITVTDGQWQTPDDEEKRIMRDIHKTGAVTMLLGLDRAKERYGAHRHHESHDLRTISDLPKAALKMVGGIMRAASID